MPTFIIPFTPRQFFVPPVRRVFTVMSMNITTTKFSQETEFYTLDWSQRGASSANPITGSAWSVPSPLTGVSDTFTATTTQIKIGGGVPGESYSLTNVVTTASGQTLEAVLVIRINIV